MVPTDIVERTLGTKLLLSHPFYRRWEDGALHEGELAAYGAQYAHVERELPATLAAIAEVTGPGRARELVLSNLDDELHRPRAHVELLSSFLDAVGAVASGPTEATAALVALYRDASSQGAAFALGVLAAYELQAAELARSKADGLRRWYGLDAVGTEFWDVHASLEDDHAAWTLGAADGLDDCEFARGVAASRDAWWAFLDEREALAPSA